MDPYYPFLIIIEYSHADPNNYSQPMHNIIIVVHNYIVVTLYILVIIINIIITCFGELLNLIGYSS